MCLIVAVEAHRTLPAHLFDEALLSAADFNQDGMGVAYIQDGLVQVEKSAGSYADIFDLASYLYRNTKTPFVVHFRYATAGTVSKANAHPFKLSRTVAMVHNKTLKIEPANPNWSDSRTLAELTKRLIKADPAFLGSPLFDAFISHQAGSTNRLVFLDAAAEQLVYVNEHLGDMVDGVWFSNRTMYDCSVVGLVDWRFAKKSTKKYSGSWDKDDTYLASPDEDDHSHEALYGDDLQSLEHALDPDRDCSDSDGGLAGKPWLRGTIRVCD